jgi:hypothetical protein
MKRFPMALTHAEWRGLEVAKGHLKEEKIAHLRYFFYLVVLFLKGLAVETLFFSCLLRFGLFLQPLLCYFLNFNVIISKFFAGIVTFPSATCNGCSSFSVKSYKNAALNACGTVTVALQRLLKDS